MWHAMSLRSHTTTNRLISTLMGVFVHRGHLMSPGYCSPGANSCQRYPVVAGEIGSNFQTPLDLQYYNDMAMFFKKQPPADTYKSLPFNNWFW